LKSLKPFGNHPKMPGSGRLTL